VQLERVLYEPDFETEAQFKVDKEGRGESETNRPLSFRAVRGGFTKLSNHDGW